MYTLVLRTLHPGKYIGVVFSVNTKSIKFETKTQRTVEIESPTTVANTEVCFTSNPAVLVTTYGIAFASRQKEINGSVHSSSNL